MAAVKITLGRDGTPWVAIEQSTGRQFKFGSRKPTREQISIALSKAGFRDVVKYGVEITELADAQGGSNAST